MLVVTRKVGEKVLIPGKGIEVMVVKVLSSGAVRLGVKAPDGIGVYREELLNVRPSSGTGKAPSINPKSRDVVSRACSVGSSNNAGAK